MQEKDTILLEELKEEQESYTDDSLFNITSFGTDLTFREIISMYEDGDLEKPELQRKYVWSKVEASRFIDSILLGLPVPSIFLAKTPDEKRLIIDGYQRIMTVYDYVNGIFSGDNKIFKLSNVNTINERWRGKAFKELSPEEKRKIRNSSIHAIVFEQKHPQDDTGMYQIFERINTSGRVLKPQEIRNCVYQGEFNTLLVELNNIPIWRKLLQTEQEDSRMFDIELILRFFAIGHINERPEICQKQINLAKYLNLFMSIYKHLDQNLSLKFRNEFISVSEYIYSALDKDAFRNIKISGDKITFSKKINPAIFDAVCSATIYVLSKHNSVALSSKKNFKKNYVKLLNDKEFIIATSIRTTNTESIKKRIDMATKFLFEVEYGW